MNGTKWTKDTTNSEQAGSHTGNKTQESRLEIGRFTRDSVKTKRLTESLENKQAAKFFFASTDSSPLPLKNITILKEKVLKGIFDSEQVNGSFTFMGKGGRLSYYSIPHYFILEKSMQKSKNN